MTDYDSDVYSEWEDEDAVEAFCVSCREKVEMENPTPVWTSQGRPGTRGICPICGSTVYRMGMTAAHEQLKRPEAIQVVDQKGIKRNSHAARIKVEAATYIVAAATEADFAEKLADDLNLVGISTWVDNGEKTDDVNWAGGVHPALDQCKKMVVVLSDFALRTPSVEAAWQHFRAQRKPVIVAMIEDIAPPDELRRSPRFAMYDDYKRAFRQLVQELSG
jgi:hypothetical protein